LDRETAVRRLARLHAAQGALYAGGRGEAVRALLTDDIVWHVPGESPIAGTYEGIEAVMDYFARRRDLAASTFEMHPGEVLVGDGELVAVRTDGTARLDDQERHWATLGLYRFQGEQVAECWLLPLDPVAFDAIWSGA